MPLKHISSDPLDLLPAGKDATHLALFLDIDGTLAPIAPTPDEASIPVHTLHMVNALFIQLQGALAIVSGRSMTDIDAMCAPYRLPAAALHGLQLRMGKEYFVASTDGPNTLEAARSVINGLATTYPDLVVEDKQLSIALHYRQAPLLADIVQSHMQTLQAEQPEKLSLQQGKMVVELRLKGGSKGQAIGYFMRQAPFQGRIPLFVGDDRTDEEGFRVVNEMGGISIKIGEGETLARYRFDQITDFHEWLVRIVAQLTTAPTRKSA